MIYFYNIIYNDVIYMCVLISYLLATFFMNI